MATTGIKGLTIIGGKYPRYRVKVNGHKPETFKLTQKRDAEQRVYQLRMQDLDNAGTKVASDVPFVYAANAVVQTEIKRRKAPATVKSYEAVITRLESQIGLIPLSRVTPKLLQKHLDYLSVNYSHGLVVKSKAILNQINQFLLRDGLIDKNLVPTLSTSLTQNVTGDVDNRRPKIYAMTDYHKLLHELNGRSNGQVDWLMYLTVQLMTHLFARDSEALSVTWEKVDFQSKQILIDSSLDSITGQPRNVKNGISGWLPMSEKLSEVLASWKRKQSNLLTQTEQTRVVYDGIHSVNLARLNYHWRKWQAQLGFNDVLSLYALRRTGASWVAASEPFGLAAPPTMASVLLRHTLKLEGVSRTTTKHYLTATSEELAEVYEQVRSLQDSY